MPVPVCVRYVVVCVGDVKWIRASPYILTTPQPTSTYLVPFTILYTVLLYMYVYL